MPNFEFLEKIELLMQKVTLNQVVPANFEYNRIAKFVILDS
jgi:hypothetical protein